MTDLIGLAHIDNNLQKTINFVNRRYSTPQRLMLELPLDWEEHKEGILEKDTFFYNLAAEYSRRGSQIIAGDSRREVISPPLPIRVRQIERRLKSEQPNYDTRREGFRDLGVMLWELIKHKTVLNYKILCPKKREERDRGFLTALDSSRPDLIIVGDNHAQYLKIQRPELNYIDFLSNTRFDRFAHSVNSFLWRKVKPDEVHIEY